MAVTDERLVFELDFHCDLLDNFPVIQASLKRFVLVHQQRYTMKLYAIITSERDSRAGKRGGNEFL